MVCYPDNTSSHTLGGYRTGTLDEGLMKGAHLPQGQKLWRKLEVCKLSGLALLSAGAICDCFLQPWNIEQLHA